MIQVKCVKFRISNNVNDEDMQFVHKNNTHSVHLNTLSQQSELSHSNLVYLCEVWA